MLLQILCECSFAYHCNMHLVLLSRATSCFGATSGKQERILDSQQQCAYAIFTSPPANLAPYELNFQLLVRGACLLAGTTRLLRLISLIDSVFWAIL